MGSISNPSVLEDDDDDDEEKDCLIKVEKQETTLLKSITPYGSDVVNQQELLKFNKTNLTLTMLHKYLLYDSPLNKMNAKNDIMAFISCIISEYAAIKKCINTTLEFKAFVKSANNMNPIRPHIFENILCGCSWNGIIYLINPINNNKLNSNIYSINGGYHSPTLQQLTLSEIPSSNILFDPNLCCAISHILNGKSNNTYRFYPHTSMIIDGLVLCNSELNTVYGYSIISGLYKIKQFRKTESHNDIERYEVIINLWRQNIDAFILTSKFNLFGIKITHKTFTIEKICTFYHAVADIGDIEYYVDYVDCWYDIHTKSLFLIYKDIDRKTVHFKVYKSDRSVYFQDDSDNVNDNLDDLGLTSIEVEYETPGYDSQTLYNIEITKELKQCLDDYYFLSSKSFLFYHKISKCLLLIFNGYIIQFAINFKNKQMKTLNIGKINSVNDIISNCSNNLNVWDHIIGYDEFRSVLILNVKKCTKQLSLVYKFNISAIRATDVASDWRKIT